MANLEKPLSQESAWENEINKALDAFSQEEKELKNDVIKKSKEKISNKKELTPRSKEDVEKELKSGEIMKRMKEFVKLNGEAISISSIELNSKNDSLLKMKYIASFGGKERTITTYFQIMGELNNSYIQFQNNPGEKQKMKSLELVEKDGKTILKPEEGYTGGKMYDINIVKLPSKGIDIRIAENPRKTQEKVLENIKALELKPGFSADTFRDETLENTKIETLQYTQLGKEISKEENGYSRAIFMREGEKYREIGKVFFDEHGMIDNKRTQKSQEFTLLGVKMNVSVDTENKTFDLEQIDKLKEQIKKQRETMKEYIGNSEFGDYTVFLGFNKENGPERKKTKLLGLQLLDETYTFQRGGEKNPSTIDIGFTDDGKLTFKDKAGKDATTEIIQIKTAKGKTEQREISKNDEKEQFILQKTEETLVENQAKPLLEDEPKLLTKAYLYSQSIDKSKIVYHKNNGELISTIPATKTEGNKRKLEELSENVDINDLYKEMEKKLFSKDMDATLENLNLLDNDIYNAFSTLLAQEGITLSGRKTVKVLDSQGIYRYYQVHQKKEGEPFIFEEDRELYETSQKVMETLIRNIGTLKRLENMKLLYKDKKEKIEKQFTQFVGGSGMLPLDTQAKIAFLQNIGKEEIQLTRTFIRGSKTKDIQNFDVTFTIKNNQITTEGKEQTINNQNYKTRIEDDERGTILRFDDIE